MPLVAGSLPIESRRDLQIYSIINGLSAICSWAFLYSKHTDELSCPHAPGASAGWMCSTGGEWAISNEASVIAAGVILWKYGHIFCLITVSSEEIKYPAPTDAMSARSTMKLI